jgi:uncharacterized protein YdeI (YjbR/CyaY-like superfamily)
MELIFFESPEQLRDWLHCNHDSAAELLVGLHKRHTGCATLSWPQLVDELLCFGWIDGVRRRIDDDSYSIRITPRKPRSIWSAVNVARAAELEAAGLMHPSGRAAVGRRSEARTGVYSHDRATPAKLDAVYERRLRANVGASRFFDSQPPWYRRTATHWVMSAKRQETRDRRFAQLLEHSAAGSAVPPLTRPLRSGARS